MGICSLEFRDDIKLSSLSRISSGVYCSSSTSCNNFLRINELLSSSLCPTFENYFSQTTDPPQERHSFFSTIVSDRKLQKIIAQVNHFSPKLTTLLLQTALANKPWILQIFPYSKFEFNLATGSKVRPNSWLIVNKKWLFDGLFDHNFSASQ